MPVEKGEAITVSGFAYASDSDRRGEKRQQIGRTNEADHHAGAAGHDRPAQDPQAPEVGGDGRKGRERVLHQVERLSHHAGVQGESVRPAAREGDQRDPVPLCRPAVGQEARHALRTAGAEVGDHQGDAERLLAAVGHRSCHAGARASL